MMCYKCAAKFGLLKRQNYCRRCNKLFCKNCLFKSTHDGNLICKDCLKNKSDTYRISKNRIFVILLVNNKFTVILSESDGNKQKASKAINEQAASFSSLNYTSAQLTAQKQRSKHANQRGSGLKYTNSEEDFHSSNVQSVKDIEERLEHLRNEKERVNVCDTKDIKERLDKLKDNPCKVSDKDIEERLCKLRGENYSSTKQSLLVQKHRTETEQIDELINRTEDEVQLDYGPSSIKPPQELLSESSTNQAMDISEAEKLMQQMQIDMIEDDKLQDKVKDLESRLKALKADKENQGAHGFNAYTDEVDSDDDETSASKLLKQIILEAQMDQGLQQSGYGWFNKVSILYTCVFGNLLEKKANHDDEEDEELPWCTICNRDASLRCRGCDDDLYCKRCYKECHQSEDPEEHFVVSYKPKRKS
ncbi:Abscission/NoCut checkpoint regulator [Trichoplax sp. H2]|nr:Abscission/NoCut checkpoint regulator [Trichoplax sp. H2]|eukprot:RDD44872.1 Abscission/NoCut checkpoint regulator [Trichoplax sp. H2]